MVSYVLLLKKTRCFALIETVQSLQNWAVLGICQNALLTEGMHGTEISFEVVIIYLSGIISIKNTGNIYSKHFPAILYFIATILMRLVIIIKEILIISYHIFLHFLRSQNGSWISPRCQFKKSET